MQVRVLVADLRWMRKLVLIVENVMVPLHLVDEPVQELAIFRNHLLLLSSNGPLESRMLRLTVSFVVDVMAVHMIRLLREPRVHWLVFSVMSIKVLAIELMLTVFQRSRVPLISIARIDVALDEVAVARVLRIIDTLDTERRRVVMHTSKLGMKDIIVSEELRMLEGMHLAIELVVTKRLNILRTRWLKHEWRLLVIFFLV